MNLNALQGKKIVFAGMGENNAGLADYLKRKKFNYDVIADWKHPDDLSDKLGTYDVVFRTPGLPYLSRPIQEAKQNGVEISSQTKLFFDLCPAPIIGVTGTKGKGTTSSLIAKIIYDSGAKAWLAGNIGKDPFGFLDEIKTEDWVVLELSSFQLQDLTKSPHIAVVLNITADHLDHHRTVEEYVAAKTSILAYQTARDYAVVSDLLPKELAKLGNGKKISFGKEDGKPYQSRLLGEHNYYNVAAAAKVAEILKIPQSSIRNSISGFEGLPHRLKLVSERGGVKFIDDSFSTNPDTTVAAINSFSEPIILILGGYDKGLDYGQLTEHIANTGNIKGIVLVGQVAVKLKPLLKNFRGTLLEGANNMDAIVSQAISVARPGDVVLLSPASASFGMFRDYKDRGDQFIKHCQ